MKQTGPILYMGDTEEAGDIEITLPWKWEICGSCNGNGTSVAHVECDGGGFTASEWGEQDDDFKQDYLSGRYDRPCPYCEGGKVKIADESRMPAEQIKAWHAQLKDDADIAAIERMERLSGA